MATSMTTPPTIDILPECLIHKILSYLTHVEAAPFRILSKKWLQAFLTHPNLKIKLISRRNVENIDKLMERYREQKIPIDKFEFLNLSRSSNNEVFPRIDKWLDIALQNGVKDLSYRNTVHSSYPFPIFRFLKSLKSLVLKGCNLMKHSLSLFASCHMANNLTTLCLSRVDLDDNMLQTLLTSCPLIVNLLISRCTALEKIEVRGLKKIRSLTIKICTIQPVKIQAPTLEHLYYSSDSILKELDIVGCQNLKSLKISCSEISSPDGLILEQLISRSQLLESLILQIEDGTCFNVCRSQSLRFLKLSYGDIEGEIDAPNLVSLEHIGSINDLKFAKESSQLKQLILRSYSYRLSARWFHGLRMFLSNSTFCSHVSLHIYSRCDWINLEDLEMPYGVATPKVDILDVDAETSGDYPTFVDALLWTCHPRKLNLSSPVKMITCFINRLMFMKNSSHSTSHGNEPGFSQLKEVKAYKFDLNNQPVELKGGELATLADRERIYFLLDW